MNLPWKKRKIDDGMVAGGATISPETLTMLVEAIPQLIEMLGLQRQEMLTFFKGLDRRLEKIEVTKVTTEKLDVSLQNSREVVGYEVVPHFGKDYKLEDLSDQDRKREEKRVEIWRAIVAFAQVKQIPLNSQNAGGFYAQFYPKLEQRAGIKLGGGVAFAYRNPHLKTKVNEVIESGYADQFIEIIKEATKQPTKVAHRRRTAVSKTPKKRGRPKGSRNKKPVGGAV